MSAILVDDKAQHLSLTKMAEKQGKMQSSSNY